MRNRFVPGMDLDRSLRVEQAGVAQLGIRQATLSGEIKQARQALDWMLAGCLSNILDRAEPWIVLVETFQALARASIAVDPERALKELERASIAQGILVRILDESGACESSPVEPLEDVRIVGGGCDGGEGLIIPDLFDIQPNVLQTVDPPPMTLRSRPSCY